MRAPVAPSSALLISTPKGKGWFYDLWRRGRGDDPDYEAWNRPSWTNPLLDADVIEEERGRLPERIFLQEYGAEFGEIDDVVKRLTAANRVRAQSNIPRPTASEQP